MLDDYQDDDDETFSLVLSDVSRAVFAGGEVTLTARGTITDNDLPPSLSIGAGTGGEITGEVTFTVSLSRTAVRDVTFSYATELDGTADENDLVSVTGEATIPAGETETSIIVEVLDDYQDDDDETFSLVLSDVSGAIFSPVGDTLTAIGTITDDDVLPTLSVGSGTGSEATGEVVFTVSLSSTAISAVTFKYRTEIGTGDTAEQADFTAIGAVGSEIDGTIIAGSSTLDIVVAIIEDASKEGDETFSLVLSDVRGATFDPAGDTLTAIGTITGDYADADGNGLLEIYTPAEMNNVRYNLAGTSYKTSSTDRGNSSGCPAGGCNGYELVDDIDLASVTNWLPIQGQADTSITTFYDCYDNSGVFDGTGCLLPTALFSAILMARTKPLATSMLVAVPII